MKATEFNTSFVPAPPPSIRQVTLLNRAPTHGAPLTEGDLMTHIVREPECFQISGLCNMQRRRLEADGKFPKRFKLNPDGGPFGAVGWDFDELMS